MPNPAKSTSFFGLGVGTWTFADLVSDLARQTAFLFHRTGFSCANLLPDWGILNSIIVGID
jgi:hypothetical protein